jgi:ribosomal protein S18 acetylase RimI-like enzyme
VGIPGVTFRCYGGEADDEGLVRVLNESKAADGLSGTFTVEGLRSSLAALTHADPTTDWVVAEAEGRIVAYGSADWRPEVAGDWVFRLNGWVPPEWRRRGIGREILRRQERRMREVSDSIEDDRGRVLHAWAAEDRPERKALLLGAGFAPYSYIADMVRPHLAAIPDAPLPEGVETRPVEPAHHRAIFDAAEEAERDHVGHTEATEQDFARFTSGRTCDPSLWQVAWEGDEVVGMVRAYIDPAENEEYGRRRGYPEHVSVRGAWRRKGIARALLVRALRALRDRGMEEAALDVHTDNPNRALTLYESVGFRVTELFAWYRKRLGESP